MTEVPFDFYAQVLQFGNRQEFDIPGVGKGSWQADPDVGYGHYTISVWVDGTTWKYRTFMVSTQEVSE